MKNIIKYPLILIMLCLVMACSGHKRQASDKPIIAVTILPTAGIIKTLAGERVEVLTLLPDGATPETYEPSMQDMSRLTRAQAWFYVGDLGFEQSWLSRIKELNPDLQLVRLDSGLMPLHNQEHMHNDGTIHASDPHYWMSIVGIETMSRNIHRGLKALLPNEDFTAGSNEISQKIDSLRKLAKARPFASKSFVIYHPSLAYFAEEHQLKQLVIEQNGKEPTINHLGNLVLQAQQDHASTMFFQKEFGANSKSTDYIRKEVNLHIMQINPFNPDWFTELSAITQALQQG